MAQPIDDDETISRYTAEQNLREVLAWARAEAAEYRNTDPVRGRAASMIATDVENALRVMLLPVP